jgi:preprotein translocase subunit SecA
MSNFFTRLFSRRNTKLLRQYSKVVRQINALEPSIQALTDPQLRAKTDEFRSRLAGGETVQSVLPEAFAVVREVGLRRLGLRAFDVQLLGGIALHEGKAAEMRTGEGKTLVAAFAAYLGALEGRGVHVVTVNDYLAQRDARQMARVYSFLGLSTGVNRAGLDVPTKRAVYACDVTYGTNTEFAFDYLRDNMALGVDGRVQRELAYAIVDEADSILIDEARTPLIISGQSDAHLERYAQVNALVAVLKQQIGGQEREPLTGKYKLPEVPGDFVVDEESRQVHLTEAGYETAEQLLRGAGLLAPATSLYDPASAELLFHLSAALRAQHIYQRDRHYVIQGGQVVIVDDFTGRLQPGRRWGDGLHQAVEAKEGLVIHPETLTLATVTYQKYFTLYGKLAGMTGTAASDAEELGYVYGLEVVQVPPHRPVLRADAPDLVFKTAGERDEAVIQDVLDCTSRGQPVLVGTTSIEESERLSRLLADCGVAHEVLNAKQHEREAHIVAQAGMCGAVTIATNMAGRGTDIVLGGNIDADIEALMSDKALQDDERTSRLAVVRASAQSRRERAVAAGGLRVIGVERSESRRIDNQLRGRSGRQGDPGSSQFYLSLDDDLLQVFAAERMKSVMNRLKAAHGQPIRSSMLSKVIESAQRRIEGGNYDRRKELLNFDVVGNEQRRVVYDLRREALEGDAVDQVLSLRQGAVADLVAAYVPDQSLEEQWDLAGLETALAHEFVVAVELQAWVEGLDRVDPGDVLAKVLQAVEQTYARRASCTPPGALAAFEQTIFLMSLDRHWREHLTALDELRRGIHLRQYGQQDPKHAYKREAFEMFGQMFEAIKRDVARVVFWELARYERQASESSAHGALVAEEVTGSAS